MLTWDDLKDEFQQIAGIAASSTDDTLGQELMNYYYQKLVRAGNFNFAEYEQDITTVAATYKHTLSPRYGKMKSVAYIDGTNIRPLSEVITWDEWRTIRSGTPSAEPTHFIIVKGASGNVQSQIWLWPTPSVSAKTIQVVYNQHVKNLSASNYATGTITVTNGDATITGSGTTFTAAMAGRAIKLPDGYWYDIASYTSATSLEIAMNYEGSTSAGESYTIAEVPLIPEAFQLGIVDGALSTWWRKKRQYEDAAYHLSLWKDIIADVKADQQNKTTQQVFRDNDMEIRHPNQYPGPISVG